MTALSVCQAVAVRVKLDPPASVFGNVDTDGQELAALLNDCAQELRSMHAWQSLAKLHTITGDGATVAFDLPSDFDWMKDNMNLWSDTYTLSFMRVTSQDTWLEIEARNIGFVYNAWILLADQIRLRPALETSETAKFYYQSTQAVLASDGVTAKDTFTADTDTFRLPENLLRLFMVYRYRQMNSEGFEPEMADFAREFSRAASRDSGGRVLSVSPARRRWDAEIAYPRSIIPQ